MEIIFKNLNLTEFREKCIPLVWKCAWRIILTVRQSVQRDTHSNVLQCICAAVFFGSPDSWIGTDNTIVVWICYYDLMSEKKGKIAELWKNDLNVLLWNIL